MESIQYKQENALQEELHSKNLKKKLSAIKQ